MKKINKFNLITLMLTLGFCIGLGFYSNSDLKSRDIASNIDPIMFKLSIKEMHLPEDTKQDLKIENSFLKVVFNNSKEIVLNQNDKISLEKGETKALNLEVLFDENMIHEQRLDFKIELVQERFLGGKLDFLFGSKVLVRCSASSSKIREISRDYECRLPKEEKVFLAYRIEKAKKATMPLVGNYKK